MKNKCENIYYASFNELGYIPVNYWTCIFFKCTKHVLNEKYKEKKNSKEWNWNSDYQNIKRKLVGNFNIVDVILIILQYK